MFEQEKQVIKIYQQEHDRHKHPYKNKTPISRLPISTLDYVRDPKVRESSERVQCEFILTKLVQLRAESMWPFHNQPAEPVLISGHLFLQCLDSILLIAIISFQWRKSQSLVQGLVQRERKREGEKITCWILLYQSYNSGCVKSISRAVPILRGGPGRQLFQKKVFIWICLEEQELVLVVWVKSPDPFVISCPSLHSRQTQLCLNV